MTRRLQVMRIILKDNGVVLTHPSSSARVTAPDMICLASGTSIVGMGRQCSSTTRVAAVLGFGCLPALPPATDLVVGFLNFPDSINFQFHLKNLIK